MNQEIRVSQRVTPIIACTALDKDRILDQCVRSGKDDYIAKSIDRDLLKEKIAWSLIPMALGPLNPAVEAQIRGLEGSDQAEPIDRAYLNVLYGVHQLDDILTELESAIHHRDISIVRHMVHEIKGSSYTVSAQEMAYRQLEKASEEQNWPEVEKLYVVLRLAFTRVRECLQDNEILFHSVASQ